MNYIEQFMKDNGIEVNEEFYVTHNNNIPESLDGIRFFFDEKSQLKEKKDDSICDNYILLKGMMSGKFGIKKIPHKHKTVWDLKEEDDYYYIDMCGNVDRTTFGIGACWADKKMIEIGNAFLTKEEAEFEVERIKCESVLLKYGTRDLMSLGDNYTKKYYIQYDYDVNKIMIFKHYSIGIQGVINFKTEELAQKAIDEVGEDRLKKYVFNVKE